MHSFLLDHKLKEFAVHSLKTTRELHLPILQHFSSLSEEALLAMFTQGSKWLLEKLSENKATEFVETGLKSWMLNQLPMIQANDIVIEDIVQGNYARRKLFRDFAGYFTPDFEQIAPILEEVDRLTIRTEQLSLQALLALKEQKIKEHHHFIDKINNASPGILYVFDLLEQKEIYTNHKREELLGYSEDELKEMGSSVVQQIIHPDDLARAFAQIQRFPGAADAEILTNEYRVKHKDGHFRWHRAYETIFKRNEAGVPWQIIGIALDISNEKEALLKLERSELQLREAQDIARIGSFEWMVDGSSSSYSPQLLKIFELDVRPGLTTFLQYVHPSDRQMVHDALEKAFSGDGIYEAEYRYRKGQAEKIIWSRGLVTFKEGKAVKMNGTVMDVTQRHHVLNQLAQTNIELERSNRELTAFNYIASHDLQEPVRKIKLFSNRLLEKSDGTLSLPHKEFVDRIVFSADYMQQLIDSLLAFSRSSSNTEAIESVPLNTLLEEVLASLKDKIDEKRAIISIDALPNVEVIRIQFLQLFENILGNSLKYSKPDESPRISVSAEIVSGQTLDLESSVPNLRYHRIFIADNGIGFDQKYARKVFELFQRLHGKTEYSGTGIGLAICKKILENHHGFITAESSPGAGAVFNIFIPVKDQD